MEKNKIISKIIITREINGKLSNLNINYKNCNLEEILGMLERAKIIMLNQIEIDTDFMENKWGDYIG